MRDRDMLAKRYVMRFLILMLMLMAILKGYIYFTYGNMDAALACGVVLFVSIVLYLKYLEDKPCD